jgi:hypothetical protein
MDLALRGTGQIARLSSVISLYSDTELLIEFLRHLRSYAQVFTENNISAEDYKFILLEINNAKPTFNKLSTHILTRDAVLSILDDIY